MEKKKRAVAAVAALLLILGGYWGYRYWGGRSAPVQATGTIEATTVELCSKASGVLVNLAVGEGDAVAAGQLVGELQRNDLIAQRERDAMALAKAEAQLADLNSGARLQELSEARANVKIARANRDKTAADLAKREQLFSQGAISQDELDRFRVNLELDQNRLQAAEARLSLLEEGSRLQAVAAAQAEVERSRAVLKATEAMLEDLKIYSPISGVVVSKHYEAGEYIPMGVSVATVADLDDLWIKVYIPTDELPAIRLGQPVTFTVSGATATFTGEVVDIASRGEFTPKTIQTKQERANVVFGVKIRIDNQDGMLKPGMPADVTFEPEPDR
ncbi:MAG: efflux RND transporter periplasmic adaptor subunit [Syntrophomonadaceae bacterium]|nr:efflux RND transporter periplasmic adaptor subunit [Syntrophomonadaceae bacterium]